MKIRWVKAKERERTEQLEALTDEIRRGLRLFNNKCLSEREVEICMAHADHMMKVGLSDAAFMIPHEDEAFNQRMDADWTLRRNLREYMQKLPYQKRYFTYRENYFRYLDSEPKHFHGDIIITDPCYVLSDEAWDDTLFHSDGHIELQGMPNAIARDTLYGDWSCTVFALPNRKILGHFCADSGSVAVMLLDDILAQNPEFNYHTDCEWTTTWIKNFDGDVWFHIEHDTKCTSWESFNVQVIGRGTNFVTGEPCNFISKQTGF